MKAFEYITGLFAIAVGVIVLATGQVAYKGVPSTDGHAKLVGLTLVIMGAAMIISRIRFERKSRK